MAFRPTVKSDPFRVLWNPRLPSQYSCVYPKQDGREQYICRPFRHQHLGNFPTPRDAARTAADWWHSAYGPDWPAVFACRCRRPWEVVTCPGPVTVWSPAGVTTAAQGYRIVCWELGVKRLVFPPATRAAAFASRQCAKDYYRTWRVKTHGKLHPLVMRRTSEPVNVPDWALARGGPGFPDSAS